MDRVTDIINHADYIKYMNKIDEMEKERNLCHHDIHHFMGVARIMYIINLEKGLNFDKEVIYACGLLHDIGRWKQYEDGTPHEIASADLSKDILKDCKFNEQEIDDILNAVRNHRNKENEKNSLSELTYKSDKLSRSCFKCYAKDECYWSDEKKNLKIKY